MRRRDPDSDMGAFMRNQDLPGGQGEVKGFFAKGGFLKPQKELEASPLQRLRLLLALQQLHYERRARGVRRGRCEPWARLLFVGRSPAARRGRAPLRRYTDELVCGSCSDIHASWGFGHL